MDIAKQYARGIYEAQAGRANASKAFFERVQDALTERGHAKLLPRVASEYEKLLLRERRREADERVTPEGERVRVLVQLYRKLISANLSR